MQKISIFALLFFGIHLCAMDCYNKLCAQERAERLAFYMQRAREIFEMHRAFDEGRRMINVKTISLHYQKQNRTFSHKIMRFASRLFVPTLRPLSNLSQFGLLPQEARSIQQQLEDLV